MTKEIVFSKNAPEALGPYSQAVKKNGLIFVSGQIPINPETKEIPDSIEGQTKQSLENIKAIVEESGSDLKNVLKATIYLSDMNNFSKVNDIYKQYFISDPPARCCVEVSRLPKDVKIEIEVIAFI